LHQVGTSRHFHIRCTVTRTSNTVIVTRLGHDHLQYVQILPTVADSTTLLHKLRQQQGGQRTIKRRTCFILISLTYRMSYSLLCHVIAGVSLTTHNHLVPMLTKE